MRGRKSMSRGTFHVDMKFACIPEFEMRNLWPNKISFLIDRRSNYLLIFSTNKKSHIIFCLCAYLTGLTAFGSDPSLRKVGRSPSSGASINAQMGSSAVQRATTRARLGSRRAHERRRLSLKNSCLLPSGQPLHRDLTMTRRFPPHSGTASASHKWICRSKSPRARQQLFQKLQRSKSILSTLANKFCRKNDKK